MSAKVGIFMGIFKISVEKNIPVGFLKIPMGNIPLEWKGNKFHGKD